ncbi:hypothetical protein, partial [Nocardia arizonensis]|uniref:hypothetical protein n=1 Tax=Nocardia arizonensis TaxID=1141647 RepID=UPI001950AF64
MTSRYGVAVVIAQETTKFGWLLVSDDGRRARDGWSAAQRAAIRDHVSPATDPASEPARARTEPGKAVESAEVSTCARIVSIPVQIPLAASANARNCTGSTRILYPLSPPAINNSGAYVPESALSPTYFACICFDG